MKLVSGLALASASLLSLPAHAAPDPAPTVATDAQGTMLTGAHHLDGAAFSLVVTDWWLTGTLAPGQPREVRLMVEVHLPKYPLLDRATDASGRKLDVVILNRGPSARWPKKASERVAVVLPLDYAQQARAAGLSITVSGKDRSFPVAVPADALARFLDSYAQAGSAAGTTSASPSVRAPTPVPTPIAPVTTAPPPPAAPSPAPKPAPRAPASAPAAPAPKPAAPPAAAPQAAPAPDDNDPAITPVPDRRVRLPDGSFAPTPPPAAPATAPTPTPQAAPDVPPAPTPPLVPLPGTAAFKAQPATPDQSDGAGSSGGHGIWVASIGLQFVPTSSGAMVLTTKPGSIAAAKGIEGGDFVEAVDGSPIKALDGPHMAAKIGAPGVKVLHMIAAGDIRIR
ncbi:hypothetical protein HZF05_03240 [Sphingomonas sp. CGMCC 1.13654]|uniref:PDZ domain-containing protein n=1 Tax=Sphingomonas chungangi TaxID=2683589 RepID=A0A838L373_9SPHN|nr:hypothetical protein [Sphingomonas chungangi]MBA2933105.1 hypothetical protein [Sphingomonas chungangi]MVW56725.1 hypothetical protein [Sphingomonas chungangi]